MANQPFLVTVIGIPSVPTITEVNVRSGPGTNYDILFKAPVGMAGLAVSDIQPDNEGKNQNDKVYQWLKLTFDGGAVGWTRDDLLQAQGDGTQWGYPVITQAALLFDLTRGTPAKTSESVKQDIAKPEEQPVVQEAPKVVEAPAAKTSGATIDSVDRVKKASFLITTTFEGTGYSAYNNYDSGIVSYGLIQFTLAAGSLGTVLDKYLAAASSPTANELRKYQDAVAARDPNLRGDTNFKSLLIAAASEPEMQAAQDAVATAKYWDAVVNGYIVPRDLKTPLAWSLLFDMGVNFGTGHGFVRKAEEELGVPPRSKPGENGITEEQLIAKVAELRKESHYRQAERDNLPGLRVRGDFWVNLVTAEDWALQGDSKGNVSVKGRTIQVRKPS